MDTDKIFVAKIYICFQFEVITRSPGCLEADPETPPPQPDFVPGIGYMRGNKRKRDERNKSLPLKKRDIGMPQIVLQEQRKSPRIIARAKAAVKSGRCSYGQAAKMFGIPKSTNWGRVTGKHQTSNRGPTKILSDPEEDRLVRFIDLMTKLSNPLTWHQIGHIVSDIVEQSENPERKNFKSVEGPSKKSLHFHPKMHITLTYILEFHWFLM